MKRTQENADEGDDTENKKGKKPEVLNQESQGSNESQPVPVRKKAIAEGFPSDNQILISLLIYFEKNRAYPYQINDGLLDFACQFGSVVDATELAYRILELQEEYMETDRRAGTSISPEDQHKLILFNKIWGSKLGNDRNHVGDIEFLEGVKGFSNKNQAYAFGKGVGKKTQKLPKKYMSSLKIDNGIMK